MWSPATGLDEVTADADGIPVLPSNTALSAATTAAANSSAFFYSASSLTILRTHGQGHFATLQRCWKITCTIHRNPPQCIAFSTIARPQSLCWGGWHAILALCLDLISELNNQVFSAVSGPSWRQIQDTIQTYVTILEQRVRASGGANCAREILFCSCAAAYIEVMLGGNGEAGQAITSAAYAALTLSCDVMEQGLQPRHGIV